MKVKNRSISGIVNKSMSLTILVLLLTQVALVVFIAFVNRDYKYKIAATAADKVEILFKNEFVQIESISENMIRNGCLKEYIADNSSEKIYDYLNIVKNQNEQFIYVAFVDNNEKDLRISNDISNDDYALLLEAVKKDEFIENRCIAVADTPYNEALLISRRDVEEFDFNELHKKSLGSLYICSKINLNKISSEINGGVNIRKITLVNTEQLKDINIKSERESVVISRPMLNYYIYLLCHPQGNSINNSYYKVCIFVMICEIFLLLAIILLFYRNFKKEVQQPINKLISYLDDDKIYNKKMTDIKGAEEIVHISTHIQKFIDKLLEQTRLIFNNQQEMYEMDILNREYKYEALQSQINPHFLYNTINCIHGMAGYYKIEPIMCICESMSSILRYSLNFEKCVTLSEEICIIEKYIDIMRLRFEKKFDVIIDIPDELGNFEIIRMSLQPAVENSFVHGVFYKNGNSGCLKIKAACEDDILIVTIRDNGVGISDEKLKLLNEQINEETKTHSYGLGLRNVNLRIKSEYGNDCGVFVDSRMNEYTEVSIKYRQKCGIENRNE